MKKVLTGLLLVATTLPSTAMADGYDPRYAAGVRAYEDGNYEKATAELAASIENKPTSKAALYLGNAHLKAGRLEQAKDALNLALKLDPNSPKKDGIVALIRGINGRTSAGVTITSSPPGAFVRIDSETGADRGKTPLDLSLSLGEHKIFLVMDGYEIGSRTEQLRAGEPIKLDLTLKPKGCDLSLLGEPPGLRAAVDAESAVTLPATVRIRKGEHKIRFLADKFEPQELPVACDGTTPVALSATLVSRGRLKVPTETGTIVTVDGKIVDLTAADAAKGIGLPVGRHEVMISAPGRPPYTTVVDVAADAEVQLALPQESTEAMGSNFPALYAGIQGAGNIALREWNLGSNAFVAQDGKHGIHPSTSAMAGGRVGLQLVSRFAVEGEVHWIGLPSALDTSHGMAYSANAVVSLFKGRWTPILQGGAGVYQVVSGKLGSDLNLRAHLGVGARVRVAEGVSLRLDVRDVVSRGFDSLGANNLEIGGGVEFVVWRRTASGSGLVGARVP